MAFGQFNQNRIIFPLASVIFLDFSAQSPRLHTNHRIDPRVKGAVPSEHLRRDGIFFELIFLPVHCLGYDKLEERPQTLGSAERITPQDSVEFLENLRSRWGLHL